MPVVFGPLSQVLQTAFSFPTFTQWSYPTKSQKAPPSAFVFFPTGGTKGLFIFYHTAVCLSILYLCFCVPKKEAFAAPRCDRDDSCCLRLSLNRGANNDGRIQVAMTMPQSAKSCMVSLSLIGFVLRPFTPRFTRGRSLAVPNARAAVRPPGVFSAFVAFS